MSGSDPNPETLRDLERRLQNARGRAKGKPQETPPSKLGIAFRLSTELVAAVVVGGGVGWGLDQFFGTAPFLMLIMFFVGVGAGFMNVVRAARELNESVGPQDGPNADHE